MGLQHPHPHQSAYHGLPTPPPSTPLSLPPLPPLASTVNIHITNHNHYSIQTPPDSAKHHFGAKNTFPSSSWVSSTTSTSSHKVQYRSPLLQRLVQNLSPIYGYLTPAATPQRTTSTVTLVEEIFSPLEKQNLQAEQRNDLEEDRDEVEVEVEVEQFSYRDTESSIPEDMPKPTQIRFSASAGARSFADRIQNDITTSSPFAPQIGDDTTISEDSLLDAIALRASGNPNVKQANQRKQKAAQPKNLPKCHDHNIRLPCIEPGVDVVPCDWVRPYNSSRWNNYTNGDVQCKVPKCDTCISHETYGPMSVWKLSAPPGHTAESHRLRSRIRYLCSRCPQPAPPPPDGIGPIEMCTCVLRDGQGVPTDMWFQCKGCAESAWFEHDSKFGGPDGLTVTRRARKRKNKHGIVVRPRLPRGDAIRKNRWTVKRCVCGKIAPKNGKYGVWCTWCQCAVAGRDMIELGGAATKSGRAFLPKEEEEEEEEVEDTEKEDEDMADDEDRDSGIVIM